MSKSVVNVRADKDTIVFEPRGRFDEVAARLLDEMVTIAVSACSRVVVDFGYLAPGRHDGLRLLPVIERRNTVLRNRPAR